MLSIFPNFSYLNIKKKIFFSVDTIFHVLPAYKLAAVSRTPLRSCMCYKLAAVSRSCMCWTAIVCITTVCVSC